MEGATHSEPEIVTTPVNTMRVVRSEVERRAAQDWPDANLRLQNALWPHPKHGVIEAVDGVSTTTLSRGRHEARYCLPYRYKTALAAEVSRRANLAAVDMAIADLIAFRAELQSVVEEPDDLTKVQDEAFREFNEAVEHIYEHSSDGELEPGEKRTLIAEVGDVLTAGRRYQTRLKHDLTTTETLAARA